MILKNNTVNVGVYGHNSTIENETVVYIHHLKNCKNPCKMTDVIIDYLELELFIKDGYVVSDEYSK